MSDLMTRLNTALSGRYRLERERGVGGMATVYLAYDERHDRKVAIKVLHPELAALLGSERFLTEIRTTAHLQHPHILPLFDSGDAGGFLFYVMPFVEGESLRERLDRAVQLPVEEAVRIATAVASALAHAHRQGVIHRDVKPENVLMQDGEPLVTDFGIALAVSAGGGTRLTETGLSLGTPAYMSPEQANADPRIGPQSDVYSLGCVLYEMLAGEPPFTARTARAVLARKMTERPPPVVDLRATVPANVAAAVMKSIEPVPADRFETVEAFAHALADASFTHATASGGQNTFPPVRRANRAPWVVAATAAVVAIVATVIAMWSFAGGSQATPQPTFRMALTGFQVGAGPGWRLAISRDGKTVVAVGTDGLLHTRRSDDTDFRPIPGTEGARNPSVSPDGEWVAFEHDGALFKVPIASGRVVPVADTGFNPDWYAPDEIAYDGYGHDIYRVSAGGGVPELLLRGRNERPFVLPDGKGVLASDSGGLYLFDLRNGHRTMLAEHGSNGRYVPTGDILYGDRDQQAVFALGFDLRAHRVSGTPVRVLPSVQVRSGGAVQLAISDNGTLLYALGESPGAYRPLAWVDTVGTATDLLLKTDEVLSPRISPDGGRVSFVTRAGGVEVYEPNTGSRTEVLTTGGSATWSPDGAYLYVTEEDRDTVWYRAPVDRPSALAVVPGPPRHGPIESISPDGAWLVGEDWSRGDRRRDIVVAHADDASVEPTPYLHGDWSEERPAVSPDGHWLAYVSDENGEARVYVRSFPHPGPEFPVSDGPATDPVWAPDRSAIYYVGATGMVRAQLRIGTSVTVIARTEMFPLYFIGLGSRFRNYDIDPGGHRFLVGARPRGAHTAETGSIGTVMIAVNWFQEMKAQMGRAPDR